MVDVGNKPTTGLRLYLEGKKSNCLAIHCQHLSSLPKSLQLQNESTQHKKNSNDRRYYEKVQWKSFSHICTAPVESEDDFSIVTGAQFEVKESGMKNVLFIRPHFLKVNGATVVKKPEWDGSPALAQKSGIISSLISSHFSNAQKPQPNPSDVNVNSALYPEGPPMLAQTRKLLRFVDTTEMTRGPQDSPGYWVVSGARLVVDKGKISLRVKYSLLAVILPDDEAAIFVPWRRPKTGSSHSQMSSAVVCECTIRLGQNGKFSYGYASSPGKRSSMEDFYETRIDGVDGEVVGLFGVFEGHGGARAAEYVKHNLFSNLISHLKFISDTKSAISDAYSHTDSEFLKSENNQNRDAGSSGGARQLSLGGRNFFG
ncbi:hypothetical protein RD792_017023 [Penstemon davidsonii]|uniref:PPM-type phosphatase domain-containing protein n=1 Tax=Penstemon davidsonii TaxID=160366 RepID=A0ABR0CMM4_9LAMI|nr:hypothetical protein RD792_017023 [Penstemon davidsonii]